jgi:hypothetical protein
MIIKNFTVPVNSIDDIRNIPDRRRFVIVYRYPDGPHGTMFEVYQNDIYDLYVINMSTLVGADYIIPKGFVIQYKNTYRGKIMNPFNPDGSFNLSSSGIFNTSTFSTRIVNWKEKDVLRITKKDFISNGSYENYIANILKCDSITPLPIYYNVEDQARLAKGDFQNMDFEMHVNSAPMYTLNDFRDSKTTFVSLDIHDDNLLNNVNQFGKLLYGHGQAMGQPNNINILNSCAIRDNIVGVFLECYDIILRSVFAQAYIILDLDSGLITVDRHTLTLKHNYEITKEEIIREYAMILEQIEEAIDYLDMFSADYLHEEYLEFDKIPDRVMIYISPARCKIKLTYNSNSSFRINDIKPLSEYSSSDMDENLMIPVPGDLTFANYESVGELDVDDEPF